MLAPGTSVTCISLIGVKGAVAGGGVYAAACGWAAGGGTAGGASAGGTAGCSAVGGWAAGGACGGAAWDATGVPQDAQKADSGPTGAPQEPQKRPDMCCSPQIFGKPPCRATR